jgi:formylglycine-generating enzyme required for sulfatase activity
MPRFHLASLGFIAVFALGCSSENAPGTDPTPLPDAGHEEELGPKGDANQTDSVEAEAEAEEESGTDSEPVDALDVLDAPDFGECITLDVSSCLTGWCLLTPSCYVMGSPPDEWGRNPQDEAQVEMWFQKFVWVSDHEVTRAEWVAAGFALPASQQSDGGPEACTDPACPVSGVTWFEALFFANAVSPHVHCFDFVGCTGEPGTGMVCDQVIAKKANVLECYGGYRLLTNAEWEFMARARRLTAFYTGPITPGEADAGCTEDPALAEAGWYCGNAGDPPSLQPVKLKKVNDWGYFDTLGNAAEWVLDTYQPNQGPGPMYDPGTTVSSEGLGQTRGGSASSAPAACRAAAHTPLAKNLRSPWVGFRLAYSTQPLQ